MKKKKRVSVKVRRAWKIKPVTRLKASAKLYRRGTAKRALREEILGDV